MVKNHSSKVTKMPVPDISTAKPKKQMKFLNLVATHDHNDVKLSRYFDSVIDHQKFVI